MLDEQQLNGRVERAVAAMREMEIPVGPTQEELVRMIDVTAGGEGGTGEMNLVRNEKEWWKMKIVRRSAAAAGLIGVAGMGVLWLVWGRGSQVAFGDVVEQMKQVHAVRCTVTALMGKDAKPVLEKMLMVDPGWSVSEAEPGNVKVVMNQAEGKVLTLVGVGKTKQAILMDIAKVPVGQRTPSLLEEFKTAGNKNAKALGEKEISGIKAKGFDLVSENGTATTDMEVWADPATDRPVLVDMKVKVPMLGSEMEYTFSDFDWAPKYDPAELSLKVPEGYTVQTANMDMSAPSEGDVVTMLKTFGEMNGGVFPDGLGKPALMASVMKWMEAQQAADKKDGKAAANGMPPGLMEKSATVARGWAYMMMVQKGKEWKYAGKGVAVGEKGRMVLWYTPEGSGKVRGFDADFTVHDVAASEVPAGEAVVLDVMSPGMPK